MPQPPIRIPDHRSSGTFVYTPAAGTILVRGSTFLTVTFTPTDTTDYATAQASVTLVVTPSYTFPRWPRSTATTTVQTRVPG